MEPFWESFTRDPRLPQNEQMRASDADREAVRTVLGDAFADGRLTREEHDDRVAKLLETRTLGDLPLLVSDLISTDPTDALRTPVVGASGVPAPPSGSELRTAGERAYRRDVQEAFGSLLVPGVVLLVIWAATGAGYFWPIFPLVFLAINPLQTLLRREAIIERKMEKLQAGQPLSLEKGSPDDDDDDDFIIRRRRSRRRY